MSYDNRNYKIDALEPSKLSQSIKSGVEIPKVQNGTIYETFERKQIRTTLNPSDVCKNITKTQQIYSSNQTEVIERNFKKPKSLQLDKLNELKKQYEVLRNIKIQDSVVYSQKVPKTVQQFSQDYSEKQQKSLNHKSQKNKTINHNQSHGITQYEKKQLQMMLTNSMNKIQQLLRAQVQYKKKIHELSKLNIDHTYDKNEELIKKLQNKEKSTQQNMQRLKDEQQRLRKLNIGLSQKITSLESQIFNLETEVRRTNDQKRRIEQTLLYQKEGHMSLKIEIKKIQLQKDMAEREKNIEAQRLNKTINDLTGDKQRLLDKIHKLQLQITQLSEKLKIKSLKQKQRSSEKTIKTPHQDKEKQDSFQAKLTEKLRQLNNADEKHMMNQINNLKQQLDNLRDSTQMVGKHNLQNRIIALQQIINENNQEKMGFLDELKRMMRDFEDLESQNQDLKQKIKRFEKQLRISKETSMYQIQKMQRSGRVSRILSNNQEQINNYLTKIRRLEAENKDLRSKMSRVEDSFSNSQSKIEERIKQYSRKLEQSELQVQKLMKQNQFNIEITNAKFKAELQLLRNDLARTIKQRNQQKNKFEQSKIFWQNKVEQLKRQHQQANASLSDKLKGKNQEIISIRGMTDENSMKLRKQYQKEIFLLLSRLQEVVKSNERYVNENTRLMNYESQIFDLRQRIRRVAGMSEGVEHLWQIKETQYYNLNQLLKQMRG